MLSGLFLAVHNLAIPARTLKAWAAALGCFSSKAFRRTPQCLGERCAERARQLKPYSQRNLADASLSASQFILRHGHPPTHQVFNRSHAQHVLEACRKTRPRHAVHNQQARSELLRALSFARDLRSRVQHGPPVGSHLRRTISGSIDFRCSSSSERTKLLL